MSDVAYVNVTAFETKSASAAAQNFSVCLLSLVLESHLFVFYCEMFLRVVKMFLSTSVTFQRTDDIAAFSRFVEELL